MSTIRANSITNSAGTGAPDFPNGLTGSGAGLTNLPSANLTGALPAIDGSALTNLPAPTSNQVGSATAGLAYGAVGTYAFVYLSGTGVTEDTTYAGSSLNIAGIHSGSTSVTADSTGVADLTRGSATLSGTWRVMARSNAGSALTRARGFLALRIS